MAEGKQDNSLQRFKRMMALRAEDIVQCDVGYLGGLTSARQVAEMAELSGLPCTPCSSNRTLLQVFTLHLVAAMSACHQPYEPLVQVVRASARL